MDVIKPVLFSIDKAVTLQLSPVKRIRSGNDALDAGPGAGDERAPGLRGGRVRIERGLQCDGIELLLRGIERHAQGRQLRDVHVLIRA